MNETKHSPGPWHVRNWGEVVSISNGCRDGIAVLNPRGNSEIGIPDRQDRVDAALIAAAPELLEALKYLLQDKPGTAMFDEWWDVRARGARAAIAKAEGGAA